VGNRDISYRSNHRSTRVSQKAKRKKKVLLRYRHVREKKLRYESRSRAVAWYRTETARNTPSSQGQARDGPTHRRGQSQGCPKVKCGDPVARVVHRPSTRTNEHSRLDHRVKERNGTERNFPLAAQLRRGNGVQKGIRDVLHSSAQARATQGTREASTVVEI
jgi:hypothetical protein